MTLNLNPPDNPPELRPRIVVFGIGGAGCNAVNNMIKSELEGVECVVANTDAQALNQSSCERRIQMGLSITQGLGAGSRPEIGRAAAEEGLAEIIEQLQGSHMVFLTAGMGGGTGTGGAPVIARAAREHGILTVGVVTKPFHFEGAHRMRIADEGIDELQEVVDTLIVIPNQNLFRLATERTTFSDAFGMADDVLYSGVRGITDLMIMPGLINLDFADIRTVMSEMGKAMMGAGEAEGEGRAVQAAEAAISNPLLDDVSMAGARGLLINITGGTDLTLYEVDEAANRVRDEVDPTANIIFGSAFDEKMEGHIRVSVFATGIDSAAAARPATGARTAGIESVPPAFAAAHPETATEEPLGEPDATQLHSEPEPASYAAPEADRDAEADLHSGAYGEPDGDAEAEPYAEPDMEAEPAAAALSDEEEPDFSATAEDATDQGDMFTAEAGGTAAEADEEAAAAYPAPEADTEAEPRQSFFGLRRRKRRDDAPAGEARHYGSSESGPADPVAETPDSEPEEPAERRQSVAVKISRPVFGERTEPDETSDSGETAEPVGETPHRGPAPSPADEPPSAAEDGEGEGSTPKLEAASGDAAQGAEDDDDDLLEIPAFLRRQAN